MSIVGIALCVVFVTLAVARAPIASAGTLQGSIVPSPNQPGPPWSIVTSPNATTTEDNYLESTSCVGTSFCMAAGYYYTGSYDQTLVQEWNGTSWSIVTSPNTSTAQNNYLYSVSCTSTTFCMAAGDYVPSYDQTLIEQWNGTAWSIVTSPNATTTQNNNLDGVSCTSPTF